MFRPLTTGSIIHKQPWVRSRVLQQALPDLHKHFGQDGNPEKRFPILSPKEQKAFQKTSASSSKEAAVLVPLISVREEPAVLFTTRSATINSHASEISFPGGHVNDTDNTFIETALRETREEIMMDSSYPENNNGIEVIGIGTPVPSKTGMLVHPVLGMFAYDVPTDVQSIFTGNPDEVEKVFSISIRELLEYETSEILPRLGARTPVFPTKHGKIWGLTAVCLRPILHKVFKPVFSTGRTNVAKQ